MTLYSSNNNYGYKTHAPLDNLTGTLSQLVNFIVSTAVQPEPVLAVGASLCALGALMGQRYRTQRDLRSNLYVVAAADNTSGRAHVLNAIGRLFKEAKLDGYLAAPLRGCTQLSNELRRMPCLLELDGGCFSMEKAAPAMRLATDLSRLYDSATTFYRISRRNGAIVDISEPCFCLFGATSQLGLEDAINKKKILDSPLAGKVLVIRSDNLPRYNAGPAIDVYPEKLVENLRAICNGVFHVGRWDERRRCWVNKPHVVAEQMEATVLFDQFVAKCASESKDEDNATDWRNLYEHVSKVSLILAVSECPSQPLINVRHMRWAIEFVQMSALCQLRVRRTGLGEKHERVLNVLRASPEGLTSTKLCRKTQWLTKVERKDVLAKLESLGLILRQQVGYGGRGRQSVVVRSRDVLLTHA